MNGSLLTAAALTAAALFPAGAQAAGQRIAWSRYTTDFESMHIVTARPDGRDPRTLTHGPKGVKDYDPKWSPDGRSIVFERDAEDGTAVLVVMRADGSRRRVIHTGCTGPCDADVAPTWTPDGKRIAYTRVVGPYDQPNESATSAVLWTVRPDGSDRRRLSPAGIDGRFEDYGAHWGRGYVQFLRTSNVRGHSALFRMRPDATHVRRLTPWRLDADLADLSRDGRVVFETFGHGGQAQNIATVPATCKTPARCAKRIRYVTRNAAKGRVNSANPAWSPDGRRIAISEWTDPSSEKAKDGIPARIITLDAHGRGREQVSQTEEWCLRPNWRAAR